MGITSINTTEGNQECKPHNFPWLLDQQKKIVVPENFDFQYSKNFLRIRFFGIGLKIGTYLHKHII